MSLCHQLTGKKCEMELQAGSEQGRVTVVVCFVFFCFFALGKWTLALACRDRAWMSQVIAISKAARGARKGCVGPQWWDQPKAGRQGGGQSAGGRSPLP